MNLAHAILIALEKGKSPHLSEFDIESALKDAFDVSNRGVWYQLNVLADADLVRSMGSDWRLTWDGHEFLKSAQRHGRPRLHVEIHSASNWMAVWNRTRSCYVCASRPDIRALL